ncbi:MAG: hypothetical protein OXF89_01570 [Rhodospirillaceae bacterium]|nr:hypothetical protein [Rhodospirillaceae bacterium]
MIRPSGLAGCCILSLALSAAIVSPGTLEAQNSGLPTGSKAPITIEADQGVEWRRKEQIYVARGNAVARQKQTSIRADELIAHYRKSEGKKTQIWKVVATGNVNIETAKETATGETAVYTVDTGVFVLRGGDLMLKNKSQTITATGRIEYRDRDRRAYVIGNAKVVDGKRILRADRFIAHLEDARDDKVKVRRVEARGNVVITTEDEVIRASNGDYDTRTRVAVLTGDVKLTRGNNQLNGEKAIVNLQTGVSRMVGRISVLLVPDEDTKTETPARGRTDKANAKGNE